MKAYNLVEWAYLEVIKLKFGFSVKWASIEMSMVASVSYSILWPFHGIRQYMAYESKKLDELKPTRGIRRQDPIHLDFPVSSIWPFGPPQI